MAGLAKGYYIVLPPISGPGRLQKAVDEVYQRMVDKRICDKVVERGPGEGGLVVARGGRSRTPDKVSVIIRAESAHRRSLMSKTSPIDNLAALAKAGGAYMHDCGSLDPCLEKTRHGWWRSGTRNSAGRSTVLVAEARVTSHCRARIRSRSWISS